MGIQKVSSSLGRDGCCVLVHLMSGFEPLHVKCQFHVPLISQHMSEAFAFSCFDVSLQNGCSQKLKLMSVAFLGFTSSTRC